MVSPSENPGPSGRRPNVPPGSLSSDAAGTAPDLSEQWKQLSELVTAQILEGAVEITSAQRLAAETPRVFDAISRIMLHSSPVPELQAFGVRAGEIAATLKDPPFCTLSRAEAMISSLPDEQCVEILDRTLTRISDQLHYFGADCPVDLQALIHSQYTSSENDWVQFEGAPTLPEVVRYAEKPRVMSVMGREDFAITYNAGLDVSVLPHVAPGAREHLRSLLALGTLPTAASAVHHEAIHRDQFESVTRGARRVTIPAAVRNLKITAAAGVLLAANLACSLAGVFQSSEMKLASFGASILGLAVGSAMAIRARHLRLSAQAPPMKSMIRLLKEVHAYESEASQPFGVRCGFGPLPEDGVVRGALASWTSFQDSDHERPPGSVMPDAVAASAYHILHTLRLLGWDEGRLNELVRKSEYDEKQMSYPQLENALQQERIRLSLENEVDFSVVSEALHFRHELELYATRAKAVRIVREEMSTTQNESSEG